ncbi:hypothetical protein GCM10010124_03480 [Pilimelia terevasa]|uniref:Uncharacterized protein n=1 Tax=Pilimelia terevasa TaxID=53372 RepID=A0A8J3FHF7_9ACTN|nr:hypothetical protein [Pilimelia terevasa]GGK14198.1 hypothetical protein GCM10010124_03480 [Pilimelia terevasa]
MSVPPSPAAAVLPPDEWRDLFVAELQQLGVRNDRVSAALAEADARRADGTDDGPFGDPRAVARAVHARLGRDALVPAARQIAAATALAAVAAPGVLLTLGAVRALGKDTLALVTLGLPVGTLGAALGAALGTAVVRRLGGRYGYLPSVLAVLLAVPPYLLLTRPLATVAPLRLLLLGALPFLALAAATVAPRLVAGPVTDPRTGAALRASVATLRQRWAAVAALLLLVGLAYALAAR